MARGITFEDAVRRAVKSYYEGGNFEAYEKVNKKPMKYGLDQFDEIQAGYKKGKKKPKLEKIEEDITDGA